MEFTKRDSTFSPGPASESKFNVRKLGGQPPFPAADTSPTRTTTLTTAALANPGGSRTSHVSGSATVAGLTRDLDDDELRVYEACVVGDLATVASLLDDGTYVDWLHPETGWSPLHRAAERGYEDIVRLLLHEDACVDIKDRVGMTPLHWAATSGVASTCYSLVERGASLSCLDHDGATACDTATLWGWTTLAADLRRAEDPANLRPHRENTKEVEVGTSPYLVHYRTKHHGAGQSPASSPRIRHSPPKQQLSDMVRRASSFGPGLTF